MNKQKTIGILVVVAVIAIAIVVFATKNKDETPTSTNTTTSDTSAVADDTIAPDTSTPATTAAVTISNFLFNSSKLTVKVGTTVTWTNNDSVAHTVTADAASSDAPASELLNKGDTYSFTFTKAGSYAYHCEPHPSMKGTVVVTE